MAFTGPKTLETAELPYITGVLHGTSGVGKTALACSSQYLRTFVFDVDAGNRSEATQGGGADVRPHRALQSPLRDDLLQ